MKLFNFDKSSQPDTESTTPKKPRGKPFTGKDDPRNNLSGRPKLGETLSERYRNALAEAESEARGGEYTNLDALIDVLISKAMGGDQRAIEYLQERGFGKVPDRLEINPEGEKWDYSALTADELDCLGYLTAKATHQEFFTMDKRPYRYIITKEEIKSPEISDVIDAVAE